LKDLREELVSIYPKLMRYALVRVRNKDKAEELVQDACLRVLQREQNFDDQINLIAYSITIIKNLIKDQGKIPGSPPPDGVPDPIDHTLPGGVYEILEAFLRLSNDCQTILELFGLGHSYKEIAQEHKIKMGTIMSRMSRCRDDFRAELSMEN